MAPSGTNKYTVLSRKELHLHRFYPTVSLLSHIR
nr:MAG TPA: hypothetical protein [Caudoviricetes sp.]